MKGAEKRDLRSAIPVPYISTGTFRDKSNMLHKEDAWSRQLIARNCRKYGGNPEAGNYFPQLAKFPGDPEAFATCKDDIKRVAAKRGLKCEGIVDCDFRQQTEPAPYRVAPDIVERHVQKIIDEQHGGKCSEAKRHELREYMTEKLSGEQ